MECKFLWIDELMSIGTGINRNIVECKYNTYTGESYPFLELIETLWNVNYIGGDYYKQVNKN